MKAYSTDYGINGASLPPRYYNSIPRRVRNVKNIILNSRMSDASTQGNEEGRSGK